MKILLVMEGWDIDKGPYETLFPMFRDNLNRLGHEVKLLDNKKNYVIPGFNTMWDYPQFFWQLRANRINDALVNRLLRESAAKWKPDLILLMKCENISSTTIQWIKQHTKCTVINWYHDNPFWHQNTSIEVLRSIPLYDAFAIWGKFFFPTLTSINCRHMIYAPMFFPPERFQFSQTEAINNLEILKSDIVFIGSGSTERADMLRHLLDFDLVVWGQWDHVLAPDDPLRKHVREQYLGGLDYARVLSSCKIAINVLNASNRPGSNMRTFEATGLGSFLLTEYTEEQAEVLFVDGKEIVCYRSPEDLRDKVAYYLKNDNQRQQIARAGQEKTLSEHTLQHRLAAIVSVAHQLRS